MPSSVRNQTQRDTLPKVLLGSPGWCFTHAEQTDGSWRQQKLVTCLAGVLLYFQAPACDVMGYVGQLDVSDTGPVGGSPNSVS